MKTVSVISVGVGLFLSLGTILDATLKGSSSLSVPLFVAGLFFILLGIFNEKNNYNEGGPYVAFAGSALLLMTDYIGIVDEKLSIPCPFKRHCPLIPATYSLKDNPREFWTLFVIFLLTSIWYGLYGYFKLRKESKI